MTDAEVNRLLFDAYLLGKRIMHKSYDIKGSAAEDKTDDLLQKVADGSTAITSDIKDMLKACSPSRRAQVEEHDKMLAGRIVEGMNFSLAKPGDGAGSA